MGKIKKKVAVLMGGRDSEHDVSLSSGTMVVNGLDRERYELLPIQITRQGRWLFPKNYLPHDARWLPSDESKSDEMGLVAYNTDGAMFQTQSRGVDVVFIALHGREGEGGAIQGMLEIMGVPYTGSNVLGSSLAMDKVRSKDLLAYHGLLTPGFMRLDRHRWSDDSKGVVAWVDDGIGWPVVAKIPEEGSSFGLAICKSSESLRSELDSMFVDADCVMLEEYIDGMEITSAVLGAEAGQTPTALPLIEIIPKTGEYFDYEAKYTPGAADEICPARLDSELTTQAQEMGVKAHEILGCGTMSRTDMIVRDSQIYYLETNTIPGMTDNSLFPKAALEAGITFSQLLDGQIKLALLKRPSMVGLVPDNVEKMT